jgi:dTDP-4-amino-4,6-dideoxygalactose transaminase
MKSYEEVVEHAVHRIFHSYMSGSIDYYNVVDYDEIAFIFEKTKLVVYEDCEKAFIRKVDGEE